MSRTISSQPVLRLVDDSFAESKTAAAVAPVNNNNNNKQAVSHEMWAALGNRDLDPGDPRWILAAHTINQLQGAALSPNRRQNILRLAHKLGIRQFDANLVVAIIQDEARQGNLNPHNTQILHYHKINQITNKNDIINAIETVNTAKPAIKRLSKQLTDRLKIIPHPHNKNIAQSDTAKITRYIIISATLATIIFIGLLNWLGI